MAPRSNKYRKITVKYCLVEMDTIVRFNFTKGNKIDHKKAPEEDPVRVETCANKVRKILNCLSYWRVCLQKLFHQ
jgi:hypothetical protein